MARGLSSWATTSTRCRATSPVAPRTRCGFCGLGCQGGHKRSTLKTYLQAAYDQGARMVVRASAERVLIEGGRAVGVIATVYGARWAAAPADRARESGGRGLRRDTHAGAAAALGAAQPHIGRHLRLHPATGIWGMFDEQVQPWTGTMQALYSDQVVDMDGQGYGAKFETAAVHPSLPMLGFAWESGRQFKQLMTNFHI